MANTLLICGAAGFLGRHCAAEFAAKGWHVVGAGRNPMSPSNWVPSSPPYRVGAFEDAAFVHDLLSETQPAAILFAAGPADVLQSMREPAADFQNQVIPLIRVLEQARLQARRPKVLLVSSAAAYGDPVSLPVSETAPCRPISPYGFHKLHQELLLDEYATLYGLPVCKTRVFSTYGPGLRRLAVWDIAQRALGGDFTLQGTGHESRDYLHVRDVAAALALLCSAAPFAGEVVNVASGAETTIEQLATRIYAALRIGESPTFSGRGEPGKPVRWRADVTHLGRLGFTPRISLDDGIPDTMNWITGANA